MKRDKCIVNGVDVSECSDCNTYNPNEPKCMKGCWLSNSYSKCDADCSYGRQYKKEQRQSALNELKSLIEENENVAQYSGLCKSIKQILGRLEE